MVEKIRIHHRLVKQDSSGKMCTYEKAMQTFLQHLPVPVWHVAKSFKVVTIPFLYVENTHTCRFPYQKNIFKDTSTMVGIHN